MQQGRRLYYLDALRSACMLYGVFVHTGAFLGPDGLPWIGKASSYFRMDVFFVVSGFLVAAVAGRTGVATVLRRRSVALLVPLATVAILVNPLTCWLIHLRHAGPMPLGQFLFAGGWREPTGAHASWHLHLWFLASLWIFVMLFPLVAHLGAVAAVRRGLDRVGGMPADVAIPLVAVTVAGAVVALRVVFTLLVEPLVADTPLDWVIFATLLYLPYFALGVLLDASRPLFELMHRVSLAGLALGLLLVAANARFGADLAAAVAGLAGGDAGRIAGTVATTVASNVLTVAIVAAMLGVARRLVPTGNGLVTRLVDSIYTVYLLHYVLIYALGLLLLRLVPAGPVYYLLLSPVVIVLLVAFHRRVVARSHVLRLLLNGRLPPAATRAVAQ